VEAVRRESSGRADQQHNRESHSAITRQHETDLLKNPHSTLAAAHQPRVQVTARHGIAGAKPQAAWSGTVIAQRKKQDHPIQGMTIPRESCLAE